MVLLHIKRGEASQFLYETSGSVEVNKLTQEIAAIYNGRLKIQRICAGKEIKEFFFFSYFYKLIHRNGRTCKLWLHVAT
jgi:hypothetical protein